MSRELEYLNTENERLKKKIEELEAEASEPYTLDEIFQCLYNNMLFYVHQNQ